MAVIDSTLQGWLDNGDMCQCCGKLMPEASGVDDTYDVGATGYGEGSGVPITCVSCIELSVPIMEGYTPT